MGDVKGCSMRGLSIRVACLAVAVVAVAAVVYLAWSQSYQEEAVRGKALAEARTLNLEMQAVWDYIDDSQPLINVNDDGSYSFKGVYCSVAGKAIAKRFTRDSEGYVIRYVREDPRSGTDVPDEFEAEALARFEEGAATEHYGVSSVDGQPVFRYASRLVLKRNCLQCHGEPAGEPDVTGFLKEGMSEGDLAGCVSMVIPLGSYEAEAHTELAVSLAFFFCLATAIVVVVAFALRRWVARPLETANAQLQDESEEKSNFLAIMSHELRTPLSSIIAFTDIWERSPRAKDPDERKLVQEIKENSVVLLDMVNNTIDVARLEAGRFEVQCDEVDLVDVVNAVFAVAEPLAIKQGIVLGKSVDPGIPIMRSDWEALRKIIMNLVSNALKFTERGGSVEVSARLANAGDEDEGGALAVIAVADTGCGIDPDDHARIFSRFTQASAAASGRGGSGLGLFLAKNLAERLGGSIAVESAPGKGSTFTVVVPIVCPEEGADQGGER